MAEFFEKIPTGQPKLPENYWGVKSDNLQTSANNSQTPANIFDTNVNASLADISIFKKNI